MLSTFKHDRPMTCGSAMCLLILAFLAAGGGQALAQCGPDPDDSVPLEMWDPQCYASCGDPNCANSPSDPNACCATHCTLCLGAKGCLPLAKSISWFDADQDGWPDAFTWYRDPISSTNRRRLYFNGGLSSPLWTEGCLVKAIGDMSTFGRGCTVGDVDNDGYPDYASEIDENGDFLFLYNRGRALRVRCATAGGCGSGGSQCNGCDYANFIDKAGCLGMVISGNVAETNAFADVDGDGDLDLIVFTETTLFLFVNHYANDPNGLDPNCTADPNCSPDPNAYKMVDYTDPNNTRAGLDPNGTGVSGYTRPEGVQFCDYDRDGDLDLFYGNRIWQNISVTADAPLFKGLNSQVCGIGSIGVEEGALFIDIDMDGDLDMVRVRDGGNAYFSRARGDGTFVSVVVLDLEEFFPRWGVSAADWDNDGDADLTVGRLFLRNKLLEQAALGTPCAFGDCLERVAFPAFPDDPNAENAVPAWADVDRDGDLDCAHAKLDHHSGTRQLFLRNHLYTSACDEADKRYVNVRPVRPIEPVDPNDRDYSENEFGAQVELVVRNNPDEDTNYFRRVQFTASSSGYVNQNEYLLHFGLPPDPEPEDPNEDVRFDLYVDFPVRVDEPTSGPWRVDWTVNSRLSGASFTGINLADLYVNENDPDTLGRPITVYRDGRVTMKSGDGLVTFEPNDPNGARMYTLGGPLRLPPDDPNDPNSALPGLTTGDKLAGCRFTKASLLDPNNTPIETVVRIREFIIDGQLDEPDPNGCPYNIVVLDVTDPNNPVLIGGLNAKTFPSNRRTFIPVPPDPNDPNAFVLPDDPNSTRTYDVRVRLTSYRANALSDLSALNSILGITVSGGLSLVNSSGADICTHTMSLQFGGASYTSPVKVRLSRKN